MACTDCQKNAANKETGTPAMPGGEPVTLTYTAAQTHVTGIDGHKRRIDGPLVEARNRGQGGWRVELIVKGYSHVIDGDTPQQVFTKADQLFRTNGLTPRAIDLWFNLNKQWIERSVKKRQMVTVANLMEAAAGSSSAPLAATKQRKNTPPAVWGRKGWGMLQMYLALDNYSYPTFLALASELATWVDPDKNPSTGCADCYKHFSLVLADLQKSPRYTQREAREWLVAAMNRVNRIKIERGEPNARVLTYEQAATANYWSE